MITQELIDDFLGIAKTAHSAIKPENIKLELLPAPHNAPTKLPTGKMAIYIFWIDGRCLKVGKAGPKSQARFTSQHYNPKSAASTLAASILKSKDDFMPDNIGNDEIGNWIKSNVSRANILIDVDQGIAVLNLCEAFMQCRLQPIYEGFTSQVR